MSIKKILIIGISLVLTITIIAILMRQDDSDKKLPDENTIKDDPLTNIEQSDINFIRRASSDIEFEISFLGEGKVNNFILVKNQNNIAVDSIILPSANSDNYIIKAPLGGYKGGNTYVLSLGNGVNFVDQRFSGKDEITFTVARDEIF